jgi:hypothetical protein
MGEVGLKIGGRSASIVGPKYFFLEKGFVFLGRGIGPGSWEDLSWEDLIACKIPGTTGPKHK